MLQIELPQGKQAESILQSQARINIWHGSVRSGKTIGSILRWLDEIDRGPAGEFLMVGKTERTLRRNIINPIQDLLEPGELSVSWGTGEAELWGRTLYLVGAADERAEQKIRGATIAGAYGDELTLWPESFFGMMLSRMSVRGAKFFGTTNPDSPRHWLKINWLDRAAELDLLDFHFRLPDNPYLDAKFIEALAAEYTGLWRRRFIEGQWVLAEGSIWDMFDVDVHIVRGAVPECDHYWVAVDYGTVNPFVALLLGFSEGRLYVCGEWRWDSMREGYQLTDQQYSERARAWVESAGVTPVCWFVDPSAASFSLQLRNDGVGVVDADNDVANGLRSVATEFSCQRLFVHESCVGLLGEIDGYTWDPKAQEKGKDAPLKVNDHGPDALRYGVYTLRLYGGLGEDLSSYGWVA